MWRRSADGDYFGPVLNRAARVMAAGHGGQILVSASTAGLAIGVELVDLGEHRLRDLSGVEHLFQVRSAGLRVDFPPLRDRRRQPRQPAGPAHELPGSGSRARLPSASWSALIAWSRSPG